jgi:hypothetical protein
LQEKLTNIQKACAIFDKNTAKAELNELKLREWPGHITSVLDEISINLLHSSFKLAAAAAIKKAEELGKQLE